MLEIYRRLFQASRTAGIVANMLQEDIVNEGKKVDIIENEDDYHRRMREAKTKADEIVQEILLQSLLPEYKDMFTLDAEEDTISKQHFKNDDYTYTLVLDPIDGTLDYLFQKDTWSICSAVLHNHDVLLAIVYFPKRDCLYSYVEGKGCRIYHNLAMCTEDDGEELDYVSDKVPALIYKNSRLSDTIVERLKEKGFTVIDDSYHHIGCPDAILECMKGNALAYFSDTRNIRDILLGAILGKMNHGNMYDFSGNSVQWEKCGRQKEIVFSIFSKDEIFD